MRKKLFSLLSVSLLAAFPALAEFEGILEMKLSMTDKGGSDVGGGLMHLSVAKAGSRMEMDMQAPAAMKMVMLTKSDTPDKVYQINDADRTYSEVDVAKDKDAAKQDEDTEPWRVKKLGEEKILGYKTQHVSVTHKQERRELWTSRELIDYATYSKLQAAKGRMAGEQGMVRALKDAGVDGMPLKAIINQGDMKITVELVKADKQSVPAATFEIPAGYTKGTGGFPSFYTADPRARDPRKAMDEALKNMTPEQRARIEKMMRERSGANPNP